MQKYACVRNTNCSGDCSVECTSSRTAHCMHRIAAPWVHVTCTVQHGSVISSPSSTLVGRLTRFAVFQTLTARIEIGGLGDESGTPELGVTS